MGREPLMGQERDSHKGRVTPQPWGGPTSRRRPHGANVDPVEHEELLWGRTFLCPIGVSMGGMVNRANPTPNGASYWAGEDHKKLTLTQKSTKPFYGARPLTTPLGSPWGEHPTGPILHPTGVPMGQGKTPKS